MTTSQSVALRQLLKDGLPTFPDVLVRLVQSYHISAVLLVDNSGSMGGNGPRFTATYERLQKLYGDQSFDCLGFHHLRIPGTLLPSDFLKQSGLTDLTIPLDQATEALQQGCCTIILFTDGANNAASESAMYSAMTRFYDAVCALDPCWHVSFHFISVGDYYPKSTISALSSLFQISHERVEVTVTDVNTFIESGFNPATRNSGLQEFHALVHLRNALPSERKEEINRILVQFIEAQERREPKEVIEQKVDVKTLKQFIDLVLGSTAKVVRQSTQMRALLNGARPDTNVVATMLSELLSSNEPFLDSTLPSDFDVQANAALVGAGDTTCVAQFLFDIHAVRNDQLLTFSASEAIAANNMSRFTCVLAVPKAGIAISLAVKMMLDEIQARLASVTQSMSQKTRINYLVIVLQLGLQEEIKNAVKVVGECWIQESDRSPYTPHMVEYFATQMLHDLRYTKQGDRQQFGAGGEIASQLAVLWCIFANPNAYAKATRGPHAFGSQAHVEMWLAVTGMWARFATDTRCWDLYTMLQTKVDLPSYAALIVSLRGGWLEDLQSSPERFLIRTCDILDSYVGAATRAVEWNKEISSSTTRRERNLKVNKLGATALAHAQQTMQRKLEHQDAFCDDIKCANYRLSCPVHFLANPAEQKSATLNETRFTDEQTAAIFALSGITDIKALSDHGLSLIRLLQRKPKQNRGVHLEIFRLLGKCLNFGPQRSVRAALDFVKSQCSICTSLPETGMASTCVNDFLTYVTSFEPLFDCPPPTGWVTPAWKELNLLTGIDLETVPLTLAIEHQSHILQLAKSYQNGMNNLHSGQYKWFSLPQNPDGTISTSICACGSQTVSLTPGKVYLHPEKAKKQLVKIACLPKQTHSVLHHTREWALFKLHGCQDAQAALTAIKRRISIIQPREMFLQNWVQQRGGAELWLSLSYEELSKHELTKDTIVDLEMNEEYGTLLSPSSSV